MHAAVPLHAAVVITAWPALANLVLAVLLHGMPAKHALVRRARRTCPRCVGLSEARQQLEVAGKVVVWLLHVANPSLLAARQLQLRGVITVQGRLTAQESEEWEADVDVSCPGVHATMRLDLVRI